MSLAYMAANDTEWSATREKDWVTLRLKAPLNFDYNAKEYAWVNMKDSKGKTTKLKLTEASENSPWFSIKIKSPGKNSVVSYGFGYFEKSIALPVK
jgi:hypothetical protein